MAVCRSCGGTGKSRTAGKGPCPRCKPHPGIDPDSKPTTPPSQPTMFSGGKVLRGPPKEGGGHLPPIGGPRDRTYGKKNKLGPGY